MSTRKPRGKPASKRTTEAFKATPRHLGAVIAATAGRAASATASGLAMPLPPLRLPSLKARRPTASEIAEVVAEVERAVEAMVTADAPEDCAHYVPRPDIVAAFRAVLTVGLRWAAQLDTREVRKAQQRYDITRELLVGLGGFRSEATGSKPDKSFRWPRGAAPSGHVRQVLQDKGPVEAVVAYAAERTGSSVRTVHQVLHDLDAPAHDLLV